MYCIVHVQYSEYLRMEEVSTVAGSVTSSPFLNSGGTLKIPSP